MYSSRLLQTGSSNRHVCETFLIRSKSSLATLIKENIFNQILFMKRSLDQKRLSWLRIFLNMKRTLRKWFPLEFHFYFDAFHETACNLQKSIEFLGQSRTALHVDQRIRELSPPNFQQQQIPKGLPRRNFLRAHTPLSLVPNCNLPLVMSIANAIRKFLEFRIQMRAHSKTKEISLSL